MLRLAIKDSSGERVFSTDRAEILVGSREGADVRLLDGAVAPNHCILRAEGNRVRLIGLSSTAATLSQGKRVTEALLAAGAEFRVGGSVVRVVQCAGAPRIEIEEPAFAAPAPPAPPPLRPAPPSDFEREVRVALSRAPWYMISLAVHVIALLLMSLVSVPPPPLDNVARMTATPKGEMPEPEVPPETPIDLDALQNVESESDIEIDEPLSAATRKDPADAEISEIDEVVPPDRIGPLGGRRPQRPLDRPLPFAKKKGGSETLNKGDLESEHGRATDEVQRDLGDGIRAAKQRLTAEHIFAVKGNYDKIEDLLDSYGWPHTLVSREELLSRGCPKARLLFINCGNRPSAVQASKLADLIKALLGRGCWVVTSDWAADPYLTLAFPQIVHVTNKDRAQRDTTVTVKPVAEDPLLDGAFPRGGDSTWWLEDSSTMVTLDASGPSVGEMGEARKGATVLIASDDMLERYGSRVVAFKFPYKHGLVLHLVGHFYQKDGNRRGLAAMHRLINNVILERMKAER